MSELLLERRGPVAVVRLNRPEKRNALSRALLRSFHSVGEELHRDDSVRLVVLTGAGDKAFCAGADLTERATMNDDDVRAQLAFYREAFQWLRSPELPTLAALNGLALGGGLEIALWCDYRVAHRDAVLGLVETSPGVIPGAGGTQFLPRIVGEARAKELITFSRKLSAVEAHALGLVNAVLEGPAEETLEGALAWAAPLLQAAPLAVRAALAAIQSAEEPLPVGLRREIDEYERCLVSEDRLEALSAFREKRAPQFRGR